MEDLSGDQERRTGAVSPGSATASQERTPLIWTIKKGHTKIAALLLEFGSNPDTVRHWPPILPLGPKAPRGQPQECPFQHAKLLRSEMLFGKAESKNAAKRRALDAG